MGKEIEYNPEKGIYRPDTEALIADARDIVTEQIRFDEFSFTDARSYQEKSRWAIEFYGEMLDRVRERIELVGESGDIGRDESRRLEDLVIVGSPVALICAKENVYDNPYDRYCLTILSNARHNKRGSKVILNRTDFRVGGSDGKESIPIPEFPQTEIAFSLTKRKVQGHSDLELELRKKFDFEDVTGLEEMDSYPSTKTRYAIGTTAAIGASAILAVGTKIIVGSLRKKE